LAFAGVVAGAQAASVGGNVRVTVDTGSVYVSADQLAGGTYSDAVLQRCGVDRRMQNEPTLAIDPRAASVWVTGANDYCTVPTVGDAWPGFYRSSNGGARWTDSLLPGYKGDTSSQGLGSPLHQMVVGGALGGGDPVQAFDGQGDLEEQLVGVVTGEDLHADRQPFDESARDRHGRVAGDVGDDRQRAHVHEVGESFGCDVEQRRRELRKRR